PDKLLVNFIPPQERRAFRAKLAQLNASDIVQEWIVHLQRRQGELLDASMSVAVVRNSQGNLISLRWIVRDVTQQKRDLRVLQSNDYNPCKDRPKHLYCKGEIIPLESQAVWLVHRGLVKLSTMGERGEEILVGLVGPSLPFSSGMTSLNTYQATALSEKVELVSISVSEIAASSRLSQAILPKINQRLRQTEFLLAISGRRQIKERLDYLLLFLKKEIGQKVAQGTRLKVRLTHQDLADACGTTRVTITRLLGKLQKAGKIAFDSKHHIIFRDIND
ncbi:MAG TPA: helix-turn-helix domain-containing protein, partial [Oculatellaceae cyanobacterium]